MALSDLALSLMTFPQDWDGAGLDLNVLLVPATDPTANLSPSGPPFSGTTYTLQAIFIPGLDSPPAEGDPASKVFTVSTPAPASASTLFNALKAKLAPTAIAQTSMAGVSIRKALPPSYTSSFAFEQPRNPAFFSLGEDFGCSMRGKDPQPLQPPPPATVSWGQIISYALHQPELAAALGLVYASVRITPAPADVAGGGWLYVRFDPASDPYAADLAGTPDLIRTFAARIPPLTASRSLFAPLLFPVSATSMDPEVYDQANLEVQEYDDGFAKIVHCSQPTSADAAIGDQNQLVPATDAGIQIGWDDEQVTVWHNRQLDGSRATTADNLPLGVLGYRVDVQEDAAGPWTPLCSAQAPISFDPAVDGVIAFEPPIEPVPTRSLGGDDEAWLPRYFAQWQGGSLVVTDPVPYQLTAGTKPQAPSILSSLVPSGLLRYGHTYQFRTRLADLTQGGPAAGTGPLHSAPASTATCTFQRFIHPRKPRVQTTRDTTNPQTITQLSVWPPILGYPEFLFAGVSDSIIPTLIAQVPTGKASNQILGANDPDVDTLRIIVEAKAPAHDASDPEQLDGPFRLVYQVDTPFPPPAADPVAAYPPDPAQAIVVNPIYTDVADIATLPPPAAANPQLLPIPRARDLRIRLVAVAHNANPAYFGDPTIQVGLTTSLDTRSDDGTEANLFDPAQQPVDELRAMFFQPGADAAQQIAQELGLQASGLTLSGAPGQRVVFGASKALKYTLSGDYGSITFAAQNEFLDHWIVALVLDVDRDWTWDGFQDPAVTVLRDSGPDPVGYLNVRQTVADSATAQPPLRDIMRLIFFDAVDGNPPPGQFPVAPTVTWTVIPTFKAGLTMPDQPKNLSVDLPKTVRPTQTPEIAAAGTALSPYQPSGDYSSTAPRQRALWIEFAEPLSDPADAYFARVLGYGPDPLLAFGPAIPAGDLTADVPEPPLSLDPEPVRMITPGDTADTAGLDAMTQLLPSLPQLGPGGQPLPPRHFLLPIPPGMTPDSAELFGFWTYELRVGHAGTGLANWSTAQARFGRPLRVSGVQHPPPLLKCLVSRDADGVWASAPFATPVLGGQKSFSFEQPWTKMWVLLYAQVAQADGASQRNVLLLTERADPPAPVRDQAPVGDVYGVALFSQQDDPATGRTGIETVLSDLALPLTCPLSVLAVELLPTNGQFDRPTGTTAPGQQDPQGTGPLDDSLGQQRILRTSPLTAVPPIC